MLSPLQSSVCAKIVQLLGQNEVDYHHRQVVILSQDSFYRVLTSEQKAKALKGQFNFDHPGEWGSDGLTPGWRQPPDLPPEMRLLGALRGSGRFPACSAWLPDSAASVLMRAMLCG